MKVEGLRWKEFLADVKKCETCKGYPKVRDGAEAWNGCSPDDPRRILNFRRSRVLFISESPPGGQGRTFFWRDESDRLRQFLFEALGEATNRRAQSTPFRIEDFIQLNCYLLPSFSFPCSKGSSLSPRNTKPGRTVIEHSAKEHLVKAIDYIEPSEVVLLGESASIVGRTLGLKCYLTYWPTKRTGHWTDVVVPTLRKVTS